MKITDLLSTNTIDLKAEAKNKAEIIKSAVKLIARSGALIDVDEYEHGVFDRELKTSTGIGEGIAIPHCKSSAVKKPALAAMIIKDGVDYQSIDGEKVTLLFLIAAPDTADNVHLDVLARLSNILMHEEFVFALKMAKSPETFLNILDYAESTVEANQKLKAMENKKELPRLLAVTACPTGIAHTYMAQEALEKSAKAKGITIKVETNGSGGIKNQLTDEEIKHAEGIIVAADVSVEMERFNGKRLIQVPVTRAIRKPDELIDMALDPITSIYGEGRAPTKQDKAQAGNKFQVFYRHLMSGISHMVPFVVAGGIILAIAYIIDACCGTPATDPSFGSATIVAKIFHMLGADIGLGLMLPVLGGFIAYSIAGKPGLVSGFIGGFAANQGRFSLLYFIEIGLHPEGSEIATQLEHTAAGFLGAIIAGFMAGYVVLFLKKRTKNIPKTLEGVFSMLIYPLTSTLIVGAGMILVNVPLAYVNIGIGSALNFLGSHKLTLLLGAIVSGLMATDMGGPINKAAHYFVLMLVTGAFSGTVDQTYAFQMMCANIVGIMTPPIGIALATWLFPQKFVKEDRTPSVANCITGCCGITEGAIPYLVKDPVRVLVSTVSGAAIGGLICVALGGEAIAPEGGTISMAVMGSICWKGILSTVIGSLITCFLLGFLKKDVDIEKAKLGKWKGIPTEKVNRFFAKIGKKLFKGKKEKANEV